MLVLAGPGTGKTTTIVEAVVRRLAVDLLPPDQVAVLTFSRGAAAELRARILSRMPAAGQAPLVATFHSFAWQLLRAHAPERAPRSILSEPEHLAFVRDVALAPGSALRRLWPADRRKALDSPGIIDELVSVMAAARAQGWQPQDLVRHGAAGGPPEWIAVGEFFAEYLDVLALAEGSDYRIDYAELVYRATVLAGEVDELAGRFRAVYIDEYQDTDPSQVALLRAITTPSTTVVAVGDPDQAIYRFRGADVRGILEFPDQFRDANGRAAPVVVLNRTRRFGTQIRAVADRWIEPVGLGTLPREARESHRKPQCDGPAGKVEALTFRTAAAQAAGVADALRRAHLDAAAPVPWSDMAVIVRSGADIPRLRLALLQAGVPVEVPAADEPLAADPALAPLLTGLRLASLSPETVQEHPGPSGSQPDMPAFEELESFLCSRLVGFTPLTLTRMMRKLRAAEKVLAAAGEDGEDGESRRGRPARPSAELLVDLLRPGATVPAGLDDATGRLLDSLQDTLAVMRAPAASVADSLWALWEHEPEGAPPSPPTSRRGGGQADLPVEGGRWARELYADALAGGRRGFTADATLDSVSQLFRAAERTPAGVRPGAFVDDLARQRVPAAPPASGAAFNRDCVRLLTAHRAKGLQWPLVVLVGLQQGSWPDARERVGMLASQQIGPDGLQPPLSRQAALADERRLAFVAATRAERRLVLTAIASEAEDQCPSDLFVEAAALDQVDVEEVVRGTGRSLTPAALAADLRRRLQDRQADRGLRIAAAARLAHLSQHLPGGPLCSAADPDRWWGLNAPTVSESPLVAADSQVPLSASAIEVLGKCSLRWMLSRKAEAKAGRSVALGYGSLVHAVAAAVIEGHVEPTAAAMSEALATAFGELRFGAEWEAEHAWSRAQADLGRLATWFEVQPCLPLAAEVEFSTPAGADSLLRGSIDAVLSTGAGYRVVDFKTGKNPISKEAALTDVQLAVYQFAVGSGGLELADPGPPDGATLVYLGKIATGRGAVGPDLRHQPALDDDSWLIEKVDTAAAIVRGEDIVATANDSCARCDVRALCPLQSQIDWTSPEDGPRGDDGQ